MTQQFADEKVLLFCSEKCKKEYIKMKLERIKAEYPGYYKKMMKSIKNPKENPFWFDRQEKITAKKAGNN